MKKHCLILILMVTVVSPALSQDYLKNTIGIGFGFPNMALATFNSINYFTDKPNYMSKGFGPFHLKYENRISKVIGLGVNMNYVQYKVSYTEDQFDTLQGIPITNTIGFNYWNLATNFRANVHFTDPEIKNVDVYMGIGLGFRLGQFKVTATVNEYKPSVTIPSLSYIGLEGTIGCRYYPTKNIGVYGEIGFAKSIIQLGVTGRF